MPKRERALPGRGPTAALAACGLLLAVALAGPPPAADGQEAAPPGADTVRATLFRIDVEAGAVDVLGGVGFAVGVTRVHTVPETTIYVGGEPSGLEALRRGQLVRIRFWEDPEGYGDDVPGRVARSIHVMPEPGGAEGGR